MRFIRANSVKWNIDLKKIGVMGASSGGHLASTLGTHTEDVSAIKDSLDQYLFLPQFMILISPVISMGKYTHQGSLNNLLGENPSPELINRYSNELQVNENTCPAFIVHAANDKAVNPMNSILFYQSLSKYNIPASLHIFPQGGHGIGVVGNPGSTDLWMELCRQWLLEIGIVNSN
jgi:acetyl esterase/lipase